MGWLIFLIFVAPLLSVFFVLGWIWCAATDGFVLAKVVYEMFRRSW